jgi:hypothetical protein
MKGFIVVNYLSLLSLRIMLDVSKVRGLHTQKLIRINPSKRGNPSDQAGINQKSHNHKSKCHLLIEHLRNVDVLRNDEGRAFPETLCWRACLNCKYMEINTQHFSWTHSIWWGLLKTI